MKNIFQNTVHFTDPETGERTIFEPGDEAPNRVANMVDPKHFIPKNAVEEELIEAGVDYNRLKADQLRELCLDRGLDTNGNKSQLVGRLEAADGALD